MTTKMMKKVLEYGRDATFKNPPTKEIKEEIEKEISSSKEDKNKIGSGR